MRVKLSLAQRPPAPPARARLFLLPVSEPTPAAYLARETSDDGAPLETPPPFDAPQRWVRVAVYLYATSDGSVGFGVGAAGAEGSGAAEAEGGADAGRGRGEPGGGEIGGEIGCGAELEVVPLLEWRPQPDSTSIITTFDEEGDSAPPPAEQGEEGADSGGEGGEGELEGEDGEEPQPPEDDEPQAAAESERRDSPLPAQELGAQAAPVPDVN